MNTLRLAGRDVSFSQPDAGPQKAVRLLFLLGTILSMSVHVSGQTGAVISGVVRDASGALVRGAKVTILRSDTGTSRTVSTDDEGRYTVADLDVGAYEVRTTFTGFQESVRTGIQLTVGQVATLDVVLKVGQASEHVEVSADLAQVETNSSTDKGVVDTRTISEAPLNGRDFSQLAKLQVGVYANPNMGQAVTAAQGAGPRISISGSRPNQNGFLLDGANVQDAQQRTPSGVSGATLGVETVREFTVLTNFFSAEYGSRAGGVINAVTKSGTNQFHGSVFEFLRNADLDARNFFDVQKPAFKRNQFGFTLGGPILRDKTFFFVSYEGLRDRLGTTNIANTISAAGRQGNLGTQTVTVSPAALPYVALFPLPNGPVFPNGTGEFINTVNTPSNENYVVTRVDHNISSRDSLWGRYVIDNSDIVSQNTFPGFLNDGLTRRQFVSIGERKVFSPSVLNDFEASFNRNAEGSLARQTLDIPSSLSFVPGQPFGALNISGLANYGYARLSNRKLTQNLFEYRDTVSYTKGRHLLKAGALYERIQFNTFSAFAQNAEWDFTSLAGFLTDKPSALDVMDPRSDPIRGWRLHVINAFVQDDWKVLPRLTLNAGLRYELSTAPYEVNGKAASLISPFTDSQVSVVKTLYKSPTPTNFAPRLGFGWDIFGDGKTALRGGAGIFYNLLLPVDWIFAATNMPPFFVRPNPSNPVGFPSVPAALAASGAVPFFNAITYTPPQSYLYKYSLSLQRELFHDLLITVGYDGNHGVHMAREQMVNIYQYQSLANGEKFFPAGSVRINPTFGPISYTVFDTNSLYNALQISALKRFSNRFQFQFNYTFARAMNAADGNIGTSEVGGGTTGSLDPFDWKRDWGPAAYDVRNKATATFSYALPEFKGLRNVLFGAWELNGIVTLSDGTPVNLQISVDVSRSGILAPSGGELRPDLKPGGNINPVVDTRNPTDYWDGSQFLLPQAGLLGNLGRNTGIGPGLATLDLSANKTFRLAERFSLQLRSEAFNLLNRANFGLPNATVFSSTTGVPSPTFGRITSTATTSRQLQFALKLIF